MTDNCHRDIGPCNIFPEDNGNLERSGACLSGVWRVTCGCFEVSKFELEHQLHCMIVDDGDDKWSVSGSIHTKKVYILWRKGDIEILNLKSPHF